jgi:hypothetical protein
MGGSTRLDSHCLNVSQLRRKTFNPIWVPFTAPPLRLVPSPAVLKYSSLMPSILPFAAALVEADNEKRKIVEQPSALVRPSSQSSLEYILTIVADLGTT